MRDIPMVLLAFGLIGLAAAFVILRCPPARPPDD